jgi:Tfp pilus assembly protein PilN
MLGSFPPLRLDFAGVEQRNHRRTALFALMGAVLLVIALLQYRDVAVQISATLAEDAALAASRVPAARDQPADQAELDARAAMSKVASRLSVPWEKLLNAIAAAIPNNVVLLSFQPNASRGEAQIVGTATKMAAVLDFVERLRGQKDLSEVYLKNHETDEAAKGKFPVHFTISLRWEGQK